jgi:putative tryptophan/tyrosine transport system substrate-binding protein
LAGWENVPGKADLLFLTMKRTRVLRIHAIILGLVALLAWAAAVCAQSREVRLLVISSQSARPYEEALAGFKERLTGEALKMNLEVINLQGDAAKAGECLEKARQGGTDLVVTLGSVATTSARGKLGELPVVAGLVVDAAEITGKGNMTGVVLDVPLETQFQRMKQILPGAKNIGVLYNPSRNAAKIEAASRLATGMGLKLHAERVEKPSELPDALESLSKSVDVLWGIPDEVVYTTQTTTQVLLFCFQKKIPFVGLSGAWVKAGALYSIDSDYRDIGAQCAEIVCSIVKGGKAGSIPPAAPRRLSYTLNLKTAEHLKVEIPDAIIQGAKEVHK